MQRFDAYQGDKKKTSRLNYTFSVSPLNLSIDVNLPIDPLYGPVYDILLMPSIRLIET